jgi:hypothetical protein
MRAKDGLTFIQGRNRCFIISDILKQEQETTGADFLAPLFIDKDRAVFTLYPTIPSPFRIYCTSAGTRRLIWSANVFCEAFYSPQSGAGIRHLGELRSDNKTIFLFGICPSSMYVEGFSVDNGECKFRFSTSY